VIQAWKNDKEEDSEEVPDDNISNAESFVGNKVGIILPESMLSEMGEPQKKKKKMKNYLKKLEREKREMELQKTFGFDLR
jgi:hypothetical protein